MKEEGGNLEDRETRSDEFCFSRGRGEGDVGGGMRFLSVFG